MKRAQVRIIKESAPIHIYGNQDRLLECGEGIILSPQPRQVEASEQPSVPSWHMKPGSDILKAIHTVAAAYKRPVELS